MKERGQQHSDQAAEKNLFLHTHKDTASFLDLCFASMSLI